MYPLSYQASIEGRAQILMGLSPLANLALETTEAVLHALFNLGVSEHSGYLIWGPYNKDPHI